MDPGPLTHKREKKVPLWDTARCLCEPLSLSFTYICIDIDIYTQIYVCMYMCI
jgi:hypothetical protein